MTDPVPNCLRNIDVLVLAGGLGTRLRTAIGEQPKILAPVRGQPFLVYLLNHLSRFGARRIVLSLGYKSEAVLSFLSSNAFDDIEIVTCVEDEPLGTAGAIRFARPLLHSDPVLILNGDSYADADLCKLIERHYASVALATFLCVEREYGDRYGRVTIDAQGFISDFVEKGPRRAGAGAISAGIYAVSARLLNQIASSRARSWEHDIAAAQPVGSLAAMVGQYEFIDIGTPESLNEAQEFFAPRT